MNTDTLHRDYSLKAHNTFGIEVKAKYFLPYSSEETLLKFLPEINEFKLKTLMLGEGSNLLFLADFDGIILHSKVVGFEITKETDEHIFVRVGGGVIWDDFVAWAVNNNFGGIENLSIIPGTVGASPIQNIGAYGIEAKDLITQTEGIELSSGKKRIFSNADCQFTYRDSIFKKKLKDQYAMTHVTFKLSKKPEFNISYGNISTLLDGRAPNLKLIRQLISDVRNSKLPDHKTLGNAGSFFTNPFIPLEKYKALKQQFPEMPHYPVSDTEVKVPAGWLIDQCGLKGFQHQGAAVHKDQALVLINTGDATGQDIAELAGIIVNKVEDKYGISLVPEVNFIS